MERDDKKLEAELYTLATKEAIYFLIKNLKEKPDPEMVKAVQKFIERKKKFKESEDKNPSKKPIKPEFMDEMKESLRARFDFKLEFKKLKHLKLEKPDKDEDTWDFKVPAEGYVLKKLIR